MSEHDQIPSSWIMTTLGEVTDPNRPRHRPQDYPHLLFVGMEHIEAHTMKILGTVPAAEMRSSAVHFWPGDLLYGRLRPYLRKVFLSNFEGLCSAEFIVFPAHEYLSAKYLQYFLISPDFTSFAHHLSEGDRPRIDFSQISRCPFPLPPLPEQERIGAEIDKQFTRLEAAVADLRQVQTGLKKYRASVLKAACEGRLVPTEAELARAEGRGYETGSDLIARTLGARNLIQIDNHKPDSKQAIPEGWGISNLGELFYISVGATPSRSHASYWNGSIPWASSGEVAFCRIRQTRESITHEGLANSSTELHPPGTVLLAMIGEGKTRGQAAILEIDACNNQNSAAIRVSETDILPEFVYYFLQSEYSRTRTQSSGNNQPALNKNRVQSIRIPIPPLPEQQRIVSEIERCLSIAEKLERTLENSLQRAQKLHSALLQQAFEGKLVRQDPADEPAEFLLKRIRESRGSSNRTVKRCGLQSRIGVQENASNLHPLAGSLSPSAIAAAEPASVRLPFIEHNPSEQLNLAREILFGRGLFEKEAAVRAVAEGLRDQGLAHFQRLRKDGPLFNDIASAIDRGVRQGFFDRPKRGHVRAILPEPKAYSPDDWRLCLLGALDGEPVEQEDALRAAAEWARETMGLEFARLREDGVILRGLRAAMKEAVGRGEVERVGRGRVRRAG